MKLSAPDLESESSKLEISSLIDICFLLLVFFLVTASLVASEQDLSSSIPPDKTEAAPETKPLFINLDPEGVISINRGEATEILEEDTEERNVPKLNQRLETYAAVLRAGGKTPAVELKADSATPYQRVVDVLNALQGQQITNVHFHAE